MFSSIYLFSSLVRNICSPPAPPARAGPQYLGTTTHYTYQPATCRCRCAARCGARGAGALRRTELQPASTTSARRPAVPGDHYTLHVPARHVQVQVRGAVRGAGRGRAAAHGAAARQHHQRAPARSTWGPLHTTRTSPPRAGAGARRGAGRGARARCGARSCSPPAPPARAGPQYLGTTTHYTYQPATCRCRCAARCGARGAGALRRTELQPASTTSARRPAVPGDHYTLHVPARHVQVQVRGAVRGAGRGRAAAHGAAARQHHQRAPARSTWGPLHTTRTSPPRAGAGARRGAGRGARARCGARSCSPPAPPARAGPQYLGTTTHYTYQPATCRCRCAARCGARGAGALRRTELQPASTTSARRPAVPGDHYTLHVPARHVQVQVRGAVRGAGRGRAAAHGAAARQHHQRAPARSTWGPLHTTRTSPPRAGAGARRGAGRGARARCGARSCSPPAPPARAGPQYLGTTTHYTYQPATCRCRCAARCGARGAGALRRTELQPASTTSARRPAVPGDHYTLHVPARHVQVQVRGAVRGAGRGRAAAHGAAARQHHQRAPARSTWGPLHTTRTSPPRAGAGARRGAGRGRAAAHGAAARQHHQRAPARSTWGPLHTTRTSPPRAGAGARRGAGRGARARCGARSCSPPAPPARAGPQYLGTTTHYTYQPATCRCRCAARCGARGAGALRRTELQPASTTSARRPAVPGDHYTLHVPARHVQVQVRGAVRGAGRGRAAAHGAAARQHHQRAPARSTWGPLHTTRTSPPRAGAGARRGAGRGARARCGARSCSPPAPPARAGPQYLGTTTHYTYQPATCRCRCAARCGARGAGALRRTELQPASTTSARRPAVPGDHYTLHVPARHVQVQVRGAVRGAGRGRAAAHGAAARQHHQRAPARSTWGPLHTTRTSPPRAGAGARRGAGRGARARCGARSCSPPAPPARAGPQYLGTTTHYTYQPATCRCRCAARCGARGAGALRRTELQPASTTSARRPAVPGDHYTLHVPARHVQVQVRGAVRGAGRGRAAAHGAAARQHHQRAPARSTWGPLHTTRTSPPRAGAGARRGAGRGARARCGARSCSPPAPPARAGPQYLGTTTHYTYQPATCRCRCAARCGARGAGALRRTELQPASTTSARRPAVPGDHYTLHVPARHVQVQVRGAVRGAGRGRAAAHGAAARQHHQRAPARSTWGPLHTTRTSPPRAGAGARRGAGRGARARCGARSCSPPAPPARAGPQYLGTTTHYTYQPATCRCRCAARCGARGAGALRRTELQPASTTSARRPAVPGDHYTLHVPARHVQVQVRGAVRGAGRGRAAAHGAAARQHHQRAPARSTWGPLHTTRTSPPRAGAGARRGAGRGARARCGARSCSPPAPPARAGPQYLGTTTHYTYQPATCRCRCAARCGARGAGALRRTELQPASTTSARRPAVPGDHYTLHVPARHVQVQVRGAVRGAGRGRAAAHGAAARQHHQRAPARSTWGPLHTTRTSPPRAGAGARRGAGRGARARCGARSCSPPAPPARAGPQYLGTTTHYTYQPATCRCRCAARCGARGAGALRRTELQPASTTSARRPAVPGDHYTLHVPARHVQVQVRGAVRGAGRGRAAAHGAAARQHHQRAPARSTWGPLHTTRTSPPRAGAGARRGAGRGARARCGARSCSPPAPPARAGPQYLGTTTHYTYQPATCRCRCAARCGARGAGALRRTELQPASTTSARRPAVPGDHYTLHVPARHVQVQVRGAVRGAGRGRAAAHGAAARQHHQRAPARSTWGPLHTTRTSPPRAGAGARRGAGRGARARCGARSCSPPAPPARAGPQYLGTTTHYTYQPATCRCRCAARCGARGAGALRRTELQPASTTSARPPAPSTPAPPPAAS
ncbi:unnamed protein product [Arctia plantaginis]|uniref:Uncharacterized protein n=1 Tax=Arctia plantaginis TaxID=874455 RepID=A0A8S1BB60_ARCPL|nr:unnamed protein product [Arctia plantaginis]